MYNIFHAMDLMCWFIWFGEVDPLEPGVLGWMG